MITLTGVPLDPDKILNRRKQAEPISVAEITACLTPEQKESFLRRYDMRSFVKVFEDAETMQTVKGFLDNGMNVSLTARNTYMHRNTLMYRLNRIRKLTGFDLRSFDMAVTFGILYYLYKNK